MSSVRSRSHSGSDTCADSDANETTSLQSQKERARTPLPKMQLFIAFLIQLAEPITATVIYPFIAQFVRETGVTNGDEKATGYFAGIVESVFFMAECVTVLLWGRASDRFGRRPILLIGPLGLAFAMLGFGISTSFWPLVFCRFAQGAFNGNIGVSKSVMAELSDSTNMAEVFGLIPLMWSLGSTMGPIIGGVFANPEAQWPESFGKIAILRQHPYLLPCLIAGALAFLFFSIALVGLKETHPSYGTKDSAPTGDEVRSYSAIEQASDDERNNKDESMEAPSIRSLMIRQVLVPLGCFSLLLFTETSYLVLIPLMYSTSIANGGLGFSSFEIGSIMGVWGVYNVLWQGSVVSRLIRRFGPRRVHIFGYSCHLIGFSLFIIMNVIARAYGEVNGLIWTLIVVQFLFCNSMIYMSFATGHMFIVDGAPSKAALAVTNGLGQAAGTISRTVAPIFATSLFSLSTEHNLLNGYLVFVILLGVTLAGIRTSMMLPHALRRAH
ncbi:MFS general substrate transporter [Hymenopellis radicata]|nr:MFS general substrate transporter [Hymenopellis radicata]